jgi:catalase
MQQHVPTRGRVSYEPNSLDEGIEGEHPSGFSSVAETMQGDKRRLRPESFADHYTQARLFWRSMTEPEQRHIVNAFAFELGNCDIVAIRTRMLGHLHLVDEALCQRVEEALGMEGMHDDIEPAVPVGDPEPSPALSILANAQPTLQGRSLGVLVASGTPNALVEALRQRAESEGATVMVVAPKVGGADGSDGRIDADKALSAGPSVLFDAVVLAVAPQAVEALTNDADARDFVADAWRHCKVIGFTQAATSLLEAVGAETEGEGLHPVDADDLDAFVEAARKGRVWEREPQVSSPG